MGAKTIFITGTDTNVGKTWFGVKLAQALLAKGLRVGVMKPVETGCIRDRAKDAEALRKAAGSDDPINLVCPYRFKAPLAPSEAARKENKVVNLAIIKKRLNRIRRERDVVIVEGAGGILVPLSSRVRMGGLIAAIKPVLIVVARNKLGCVNHALLTLMAAREYHVEIAALVLNDVAPEEKRFAADNARMIEEGGSVKVFQVERDAKELPKALVNLCG